VVPSVQLYKNFRGTISAGQRAETRGPTVAGFPPDLISIAILNRHPVRWRDPDVRECSIPMFFGRQLIAMGWRRRAVRPAPRRSWPPEPASQGRVETSPDIRAGIGDAVGRGGAEAHNINNADQIERGYERIDERLTPGARIKYPVPGANRQYSQCRRSPFRPNGSASLL